MDRHRAEGFTDIKTEAPGEFLSGLLGVSVLKVIRSSRGDVLQLPDSSGMWRILSPLTGSLRLTSGELHWTLDAGQSAVFDAQAEITLFFESDCELGVISLCGMTADRVFDECRRLGGFFFPRGGIEAARILRYFAAYGETVPAREASAHVFQLLMSYLGTGCEAPAGRGILPPVVEAALGIIRRDFAFLDGVAELAERLEISQEYLTRCFTSHTGMTPGRYLNRVRIENAKLLLRQGSHSVQFVSDACGFSNANYFARVFRLHVGVNPREYARMQEFRDERIPQEDQLYVL